MSGRRRVAIACLAALASAPGARAESLTTETSPCGGDAYSSAQVVEGRPPRRGPITAVPDTLCADLSAPRGGATIDIYVAPGLGGVGAGGAPAPYEDGRSGGSRRQGPQRRGD